eukprot:14093968-Alexandrium_andersonii.AAC.1
MSKSFGAPSAVFHRMRTHIRHGMHRAQRAGEGRRVRSATAAPRDAQRKEACPTHTSAVWRAPAMEGLPPLLPQLPRTVESRAGCSRRMTQKEVH